MKKLFILLLITILSISAYAGGSQDGEGGSEGSGELTFYGAPNEDHVEMIAQEFEKATGIKTNYIRMSSGEILARLRAEKDNVSADVWFGGPIDSMIAGFEEGLVETYVSPEAQNIRPDFQSADGSWTGIYVGYLGFVGNQKRLQENGWEMPQSWEDLLKPEFKGEIVVAHPGSSGTAYTFLASVLQLMGEDEGMEYMKKFNQQVRQYTKSGSAPARMVGQGEATIAITFLHDAIKFKKQGFSDIIISAPKEGTGFEIGGIALVKNSPNPENAKKFIDWALTKEIQELGQTVGSFQFLTNVNAVNPAEADPIKDTKLLDYDFDWAGQNKVRLVERFTQETNAQKPEK